MTEIKDKKLLEKIIELHPTYVKRLPNWKYLIESFEGGETYKNGEYLQRYKTDSYQSPQGTRDDVYRKRLDDTCLDNQCARVVDIFTSLVFSNVVDRDRGTFENTPRLKEFEDNVDYNGRSFNDFMRYASKYANIYGLSYIMMSKPSGAVTRADENELNIRPYMALITPDQVLDWQYERSPTGRSNLTYIKIREEERKKYDIVNIFEIVEVNNIKKLQVSKIKIYKDEKATKSVYTQDADMVKAEYIDQPKIYDYNEIPVVVLYNQRLPENGDGKSDINDIADIQKAMYRYYADIAQLVKLTNNPLYIIREGMQAALTPGGFFELTNDDIEKGFQPDVIQTDGQNIEGILKVINRLGEVIERNTSLSSVTGQSSNRSEVAVALEQRILDGILRDKTSNLKYAEERIWRLYAIYEGEEWTGSIKYGDSFNTRERSKELENIEKVLELGSNYAELVDNQDFRKYIAKALAGFVITNDEETLSKITEFLDNTELAVEEDTPTNTVAITDEQAASALEVAE